MSDQQENQNEEPKIIIDDDWKSQVEAEKEQLKAQAEEPAESDAPADLQIPPASFPMLMSTLATQAMATMGMLPDPQTGQPTVEKPVAKHFIDTLAMLQEKTQGNLADDEATMLRDTLHQLRMAFMSIPDTAGAASSAPVAEEEKKSSIELP